MKDGKISILQVINTASIGGGMRHLYALLKHLPRERLHLSLVAEEGKYLVDEIKEMGIPIHFVPMMNNRVNPLAIWRIARSARQERADILHLHGTRSGFFGVMAKSLAGIRHSVYTVHGFSYHKDITASGRAFYLAVERLCARSHSRLISVSSTDRDEAIRLGVCSPDRISAIFNGIDFSIFDPERVNGSFRADFGIEKDEIVVGTVARLVPQKGVEYFLQMAELVAARHEKARFLIVGEGELEQALREQCEQQGIGKRVLFVGPQSRMPECYAGMDIFVLSSLWEGHPLSLIESQAMERPTVATCTSGSPEIINDGQTGFLVSPKNVHELAEKVCWLIEHKKEARAMARQGRQLCRQRYHEKAMVEKTLNIYEELLSRS